MGLLEAVDALSRAYDAITGPLPDFIDGASNTLRNAADALETASKFLRSLKMKGLEGVEKKDGEIKTAMGRLAELLDKMERPSRDKERAKLKAGKVECPALETTITATVLESAKWLWNKMSDHQPGKVGAIEDPDARKEREQNERRGIPLTRRGMRSSNRKTAAAFRESGSSVKVSKGEDDEPIVDKVPVEEPEEEKVKKKKKH